MDDRYKFENALETTLPPYIGDLSYLASVVVRPKLEAREEEEKRRVSTKEKGKGVVYAYSEDARVAQNEQHIASHSQGKSGMLPNSKPHDLAYHSYSHLPKDEKIKEYGHSEDDGFCHPHLEEIAEYDYKPSDWIPPA